MTARSTLGRILRLSAWLLPSLAAAQDARPAPATPQAGPPTFPTRSELVLLDMVARDKAGRMVSDLRENEIEVLENGESCRIQSVRLMRAGEAEAGLASPTRSEAGAASSNAGTAGDAPARASFVLLAFDRLGPQSAPLARKAASEFVARPFPRDTWIAVVELGESVQLKERFTQDLARMSAAIAAAATGGGPADQVGATREAMTAALVASESAVGVRQSDPTAALTILAPKSMAEVKQRQVEGSVLAAIDSLNRLRLGRSALRALTSLAGALGGVEGRKTLLFFSEGLHVPEAASGALDTLVSEANHASVAIYAVDPRGLAEDSAFDETKRALLAAQHLSEKAMRSTGQEEGPNRGVSALEVRTPELALDAIRLNAQANLRDLAESTGGFLVAETNDLGSAIERVGAELRAYYEIGYLPANTAADRTFRNIEVKVKRRGVVLRARRGYYAVPRGEAPTLPYELALAETLERPELPRDFTHQVTTQLGASNGSEREVGLVVQVPIRELRLLTDAAAQTYAAHVSMLVLVRGEGGGLIARLSHDWPLSGPASQASLAQQRNVAVRKTLALPPARYVLESAVQDRLSGALSAKRTVLEIAP